MNEDSVQKRLSELRRKWLNKTITSEELQELNQWYNANQQDPVSIPRDFASNEEEIESRMLARIKLHRKPIKAPVIKYRSVKWVAAASVILILSVTAYKFLFYPGIDSTNNNTTTVKNDAAPGYDKAILQLADGSTIILDSLQNNTIQNQGNAVLVKSGGTLTYKAPQIQNELPLVYNTMSTPRGGQYKLSLSDGTIVWLNSASSIRYPVSFLQKERIVELTGEAYFEVAKNASKPFYVKVDGAQVEVLGTHFNINAYSNESEIKTTLLEGSVRVNVENNKVKLVPGQQAKIYRTDMNNIRLLKNIDTDDVISWQKGIFQFRNADLSMIARQLSRWYDVDVITQGNLNDIQLGGGISKSIPLSEILEVLKASGAGYKWENRKLILYSL